jgi:hypothetical protein
VTLEIVHEALEGIEKGVRRKLFESIRTHTIASFEQATLHVVPEILLSPAAKDAGLASAKAMSSN